jgi:hypothetical protein
MTNHLDEETTTNDILNINEHKRKDNSTSLTEDDNKKSNIPLIKFHRSVYGKNVDILNEASKAQRLEKNFCDGEFNFNFNF